MIKDLESDVQVICSHEFVDVKIPSGITYPIYQTGNPEHEKKVKLQGHEGT
jgi:hypothetical protein